MGSLAMSALPVTPCQQRKGEMKAVESPEWWQNCYLHLQFSQRLAPIAMQYLCTYSLLLQSPLPLREDRGRVSKAITDMTDTHSQI